jgi:carbon-monoxide dehydrogenase small subunit
VLAAQADGHEIVTSTSTGADHQLLQREFVARGAIQCGFCTSGMVIAGIEAVRSGRAGSRSDIRRSLVGNICRCTGYSPIVEAIEAFAQSKK